MRLLRKGVWLLAFAFSAAHAPAADLPVDTYLTRHWGVEEGTPHNTINGIVQTKDGFLWMATDAGVARFDGATFRGVNASVFSDAKSSTIRSLIQEDPDTLLLLNAKSGLYRLRNGNASAYLPANLPKTISPMQELFRERDGVYWIAFLDGSVCRCSGEHCDYFPAHLKAVTGPMTFAVDSHGGVYLCRGFGLEHFVDGTLQVFGGTEGQLLAVGSSRSGGVWASEEGRIFRLEDGSLIPQGAASWPKDLNPDLISEGNDSALWVAFANYGLVRWTPHSSSVVAGFRSRIKGLLEDDQGDLWVATEGSGLNRLRPRRFELLANATDMPDEAASSVSEDSEGTLWIAAHSSLKVRRGDAWTALTPREGWPKSPSWVSPDGAGNVWIVSIRTLYRTKAGGEGKPERVTLTTGSNIRSLCGLRGGGVWIACDSGPLIRVRDSGTEFFGEKQGYTGGKGAAFCEDAAGTIWVGTGRGELFRFRDEHFTAVDVGLYLRGNGIRAIVADNDGWRWIGTDGVGLLAQNSAASVLIGKEQGLPDDVISQIVEDDFGFVWFGSRRGLFKVRRQELIECASGQRSTITPILYGLDDGLSDLSAVGGHQPAACKTHTGQLWFTTRAGFVCTQPGRDEPGAWQPRTYIDEASSDGSTFAEAGKVPSTTRRYSFHFTAPVFAAPDGVRFRYRLDGFDPDWSEPSRERVALYPRLPPGNYRFNAQASDGEGQWSKQPPAEIRFTVVPAWWETTWVRVTGLVAAGLGLAALVRYGSQRRLKRRLAALEARERITTERERIARNLHDGLGAGLTHVGMMAEQLAEDSHNVEELRERAALLVGRVQGVARDLDAAVWAVSPRHDRLPALCSYLCEYALEFFRDTKIRCRVEIADDLPDSPISPEVRHHLFLAAKEALNNALKHSSATYITVSMRWASGVATIEISDDGRGFDVPSAEASARNGLRNLRSRINEAGGQLEISSSGAGSTIKIHLPCPSR